MKLPPFGRVSEWVGAKDTPSFVYVCGHCGERQSSHKSLLALCTKHDEHKYALVIRICTHCTLPTIELDVNGTIERLPGERSGDSVAHVPEDILTIYEEARNCLAANSPRAAILVCRTLLMSVAIDKGAKKRIPFRASVSYLVEKGLLTEGMRGWVQAITNLGHRSAHRKEPRTRQEAEIVISFCSQLLKLVYEMDGRLGLLDPTIIPPAVNDVEDDFGSDAPEDR